MLCSTYIKIEEKKILFNVHKYVYTIRNRHGVSLNYILLQLLLRTKYHDSQIRICLERNISAHIALKSVDKLIHLCLPVESLNVLRK